MLAIRKKFAEDKKVAENGRGQVALALLRIARDPDAAKILRDSLPAKTTLPPEQHLAVLWRIDSGPDTVATFTELLKSD
ncbi:MAG: hypothetical protein K8U57_06375 [Planctomycetes bacterium]|nr:hypothetical protein [Planctomycetota bacterium]